jgi:hypothetical protein
MSVATGPERASTIRGENDSMLTFSADAVSHKPSRGVFSEERCAVPSVPYKVPIGER